MDIKLIRAFIASPGGLQAEREAAHAVARQVDQAVARELGGRLELIGWEETLSGSGRPQAIINADMETCDLFIGVMWTRWGSPPSVDGPFSSGFEEEFELSRQRFASSGSPTMAMFFKEVDRLQLDDPGNDLKKVLSFQEKLRQEKAFLYDTFGSSDQFAEKVRTFLTAHTIRKLSQSRSAGDNKTQLGATPSGGSESSQHKVAEPSSSADGGSLNDRVEAKFLAAAAKALDGQREQSASEVARLRLIAIVSGNAENDKLILGAHDSNLLYHARKSFEFSFAELRGLTGAGFVNLAHENVPLWSWLAALTDGQPELLTALTIFGEEETRAGAISTMILLGEEIRPPEFLQREVVKDYWLGLDTGTSVRAAALRYLRQLGGPEDVASIEAEMEKAEKETLQLSQEAAIAIKLRDDPEHAAKYALNLSFEALDGTLLTQVLEQFADLGTDTLKKGLDHRSAQVRHRTMEVLTSRGTLDLDTIERARSDDAALVRFAAVEALDKLGQGLSLDEAYTILGKSRRSSGLLVFGAASDDAGIKLFNKYRARRLNQMSHGALEKLRDRTAYSDAAYLALAAKRLDKAGKNLREDLRDNFEQYSRNNWPEKIASPGFGTVSSLLGIGTTDPRKARRRDLTRDALDVVASQRDERDLPIVRQVLASNFVSPTSETVRYLRTVGNEADISLLGKTSRISNWWDPAAERHEVFTEAARTILRLHKGSAEDLLKVKLPAEMRAELISEMSSTEFATIADKAILDILLTDSENLRRACSMKVPVSLTRTRVRRILNAYLANDEGRFYVVTHWLDLGLSYSRAQARKVSTGKAKR